MARERIITFADADDWEGLYIDGKLVFENHSISVQEFIKYAKLKINVVDVDLDWMAENGHLPDNLKEVKKQ